MTEKQTRDLLDKDEIINIFGFRRPKHLKEVLLRTRSQVSHGSSCNVHIWIDGTSHSKEYKPDNDNCKSLQKEFPEFQWHISNGRYGIEKIMLDALEFGSSRHESLLMLEDDCIPKEYCVNHMLDTLDTAEEAIASVYGCHFKVDGETPGKPFPRFQGWGWASRSTIIKSILPTMTRLFLMREEDYLSYTRKSLSDERISRLCSATPGRNVIDVLRRHFSWDSCFTLLTIENNLFHLPTPKPCIVNAGISDSSGNFNQDLSKFRNPPFNMLTLEEVVANEH